MSDPIGMVGAMGYPMTETETMRDPSGLDDTAATVIAAQILADATGIGYYSALAIVAGIGATEGKDSA